MIGHRDCMVISDAFFLLLQGRLSESEVFLSNLIVFVLGSDVSASSFQDRNVYLVIELLKVKHLRAEHIWTLDAWLIAVLTDVINMLGLFLSQQLSFKSIYSLLSSFDLILSNRILSLHGLYILTVLFGGRKLLHCKLYCIFLLVSLSVSSSGSCSIGQISRSCILFLPLKSLAHDSAKTDSAVHLLAWRLVFASLGSLSRRSHSTRWLGLLVWVNWHDQILLRFGNLHLFQRLLMMLRKVCSTTLSHWWACIMVLVVHHHGLSVQLGLLLFVLES